MDLLIRTLLDLSGTAVFAVTGALAAGQKRMDIFGVVVLACVTAMGGGTVRDVILGIHPVFWVANTDYLLISAACAIGTYIIGRRRELPVKTLMYADAIGLAVFTVIGFQAAFQATGSYAIGIFMAVITGVAGGMIRDVLAGEVPLILRSEIYASAGLCGAAVYALSFYLGLAAPLAASISVAVTLAIRIPAMHYNLSLPPLRLAQSVDQRRDEEHKT